MLHHVICAVRSHPEPEIVEVTVPHWAAAREKRRLSLKGFETVFTLRTQFIRPEGRPRRG